MDGADIQTGLSGWILSSLCINLQVHRSMCASSASRYMLRHTAVKPWSLSQPVGRPAHLFASIRSKSSGRQQLDQRSLRRKVTVISVCSGSSSGR